MVVEAIPSLGLNASEPITPFRSHFGWICRRSVSLGSVIWTSQATKDGQLTAQVAL